jgi:hypothetical protein
MLLRNNVVSQNLHLENVRLILSYNRNFKCEVVPETVKVAVVTSESGIMQLRPRLHYDATANLP